MALIDTQRNLFRDFAFDKLSVVFPLKINCIVRKFTSKSMQNVSVVDLFIINVRCRKIFASLFFSIVFEDTCSQPDSRFDAWISTLVVSAPAGNVTLPVIALRRLKKTLKFQSRDFLNFSTNVHKVADL